MTTDAIENDISLLLSKDAIKKIKTYINFSKDKIVIFDEEVPATLVHQDIIVLLLEKGIEK